MWEIQILKPFHFADIKQFKVDSHSGDFGQVKMGLAGSFERRWAGDSLFYWVWARHWAAKNNSGTMHRVQHKSFSIQSAGIKNQLVISKIK